MCNKMRKKHFYFLDIFHSELLFDVTLQPKDQPNSSPDKFRQVWAWLDTPVHTQPSVLLLDAIFLW